MILEDADLLEGKLPLHPVDEHWALKCNEILNIYTQEKELFTCAFFLSGKYKLNGKHTSILAPLLLIPTSIEKLEDYFIRLQNDQVLVNSFAFRFLNAVEDNNSDLVNEIVSACEGGIITFETCSKLKASLENQFHNLDAGDILLYPKLFNTKEIEKHIENVQGFSIVPAVGLGIVNKSSTSLGSLSELKMLADKKDYSTLWQSFWN